jgi:hypothetical protein
MVLNGLVTVNPARRYTGLEVIVLLLVHEQGGNISAALQNFLTGGGSPQEFTTTVQRLEAEGILVRLGPTKKHPNGRLVPSVSYERER